ncbi:MAG TPA: acetyltransferase [Bacteroidia bacterium]|nr:acetyltransferase [Bacteroidia bacterium]HRS58098.1 acetyltransferase [Bacteroidia bacterium]HRU66881.1 acetyltransferase [Bacteroidia bacterium]
MKKIVIIGSSGHARVVIDIIEKQNEFEIVGLIDSFRKVNEKTYDYKILGNENDLPALTSKLGLYGCIVAIGDNWNRKIMVEKVQNLKTGLNFISAVHPSVQIGKEVEIGEGTVVMAGAIINSGSKIKNHVIINTQASIDHDCYIDDFAGISPGAVLGGYVKVGKFSVIALGSTVLNKIEVGDHSIVGAGSLLLKNLGDNEIAYGIPAKFIRKREIGEKYLL